jgi:hypothetical protein
METPDPMAAYPPNHWRTDFEWFCRESSKHPPHSASMGIEVFDEYFRSTRSNPAVAKHCRDRFVAAMSYLNENSEKILTDNLGVTGEDANLVCSSISLTLYRFFVARADGEVEMAIPFDVFLREAIYDREHPPKSAV